MIHFLSLILSFFTLISAAPAIVYQTVNVGTVYTTSYASGASAGASNVGYTTLYSNAVSWTTTLTPEASSTSSEYSTVLPSSTSVSVAPIASSSISVQVAAAAASSVEVVSAAAASAASASAASVSAASVAAASAASAAAASVSASSVSAASVAAAAASASAASVAAASAAASTTTSEAANVVTITSSISHTISSSSSSLTTTTSTSATTTTSTSSSGPTVTSVPKYVVYSPYNSDSTCKDADTVKTDLESLKNKGVYRIRMYATDCNSLYTVQPAAAELGMRIVQGLWIGSSGVDNAYSQLSELVSYADGDWSIYDSIIVGNEDVTNGYITAAELLTAVKSVRSTLESNGFTGDVIAAETTTAYKNNPTEMCDSSFPFIGLNAHSYFASSFTAQEAGTFIQDQIDIVKNLCSRSDIWISETGYPWKGDTNGANVPSKQNQADAVNAILDTTNLDCVILAQYDDMWKEPGTYGIEQYFGVLDIVG